MAGEEKIVMAVSSDDKLLPVEQLFYLYGE